MQRSVNEGSHGVSLLELVIAVMILSIGTIGVMRSLDVSQRQIGETAPRILAHSVAVNRAEELRAIGWALGRGLPPIVQQGPFNWAIEMQSQNASGGLYEVTVVVSTPDGPGASLVTYVPWAP
jgi:general secretion pathway protein I